MIGYGCANTALAGLAITQVVRREGGLLKRLRATPLPPMTYLAAVLTSTLIVFVLQMVVTMALGGDVTAPRARRTGSASPRVRGRRDPLLRGQGFGVASLIRSAEGASAVVDLIVLPMAFLSGSFGPTRRYPEVLRWLADLLPLTYLIRLLKDVYLHGDSFFGHPQDLAVMAVVGSRRPRRRVAVLRLGAARAVGGSLILVRGGRPPEIILPAETIPTTGAMCANNGRRIIGAHEHLHRHPPPQALPLAGPPRRAARVPVPARRRPARRGGGVRRHDGRARPHEAAVAVAAAALAVAAIALGCLLPRRTFFVRNAARTLLRAEIIVCLVTLIGFGQFAWLAVLPVIGLTRVALWVDERRHPSFI